MEGTKKSQAELEHLLTMLQQGKLQGREVYRAVQMFGENHFLS
jgi:PII-like signaling protein